MARKIMKPDAIWKLCNLIDDEYIVRVGASDDVTVKRWQADPLSYLREGYQIEEMRSEHRDIVELALIEWRSRETIVLSLFEDSMISLSNGFLRYMRQCGKINLSIFTLGRLRTKNCIRQQNIQG